jgi:hypothetical protein
MAGLWQTVLASAATYPLSGIPEPSSIKIYLDGPPPDQVQNGQAPGVQLNQSNPDGTINWAYDPVANTIFVNPSTVSLQNGNVLYVEYTLICD